MEENEEAKESKEKVKSWLKNPYNLGFLGILILAIIIRIYFLSATSSQPLWWDEAGYMSYAKNLAGINTGWVLTGGQVSLFPYIASVFFKLGFSELILKFLLEILPSILIVLLTYKIIMLMYDNKKIALISCFLIAIFWSVLFDSLRFFVDIPSLFFGFLSLYVFWKGYEKKEKIFNFINPKWAIPLTVFLVLLTFSIRRGYFMFGFFFLFYMLLTRKPKELIKDKYNWFALAVFILLFLILQKYIFASSVSGAISQYYNAETPFSLLPFGVFSAYFKNTFNGILSPLFYLFWLGLIILLFNLAFSIGHIKTSQKSKADLFMILTIIITLSWFLFFQKQARIFGEPRWYYPLLLGSIIMISKGTLFISEYIKKYSKIFAVLIVILLVGFGSYYELKQADLIIKNKINTYEGVRDSALFIKSIAKQTDIIMSPSPAQTSYYAEIKAIHYGELNRTLDSFISELKENKNIRFVLVSFWEPYHPDWMKKESYAQDINRQTVIATWEIPFMDTSIDFRTGKQDIKQEKSFDGITLKLLNVMDRVFIYEVIRG